MLVGLVAVGAAAAAQDPKDDRTKAEAGENARLEAVFKSYDRNSDGTVVRDEFPGSDYQFGAVDLNGDQKVTLKEFQKSPLARRYFTRTRMDQEAPRVRMAPGADEELLRNQAFGRFDKNRDSKITRDEWTGSVQGFELLDRDRDGVLTKSDGKSGAQAAGGASVPLPKLEGPPFEGGYEKLLERHDTDRDGYVSKAEAGNTRLGKLFEAIDLDRDGELSEREIRYGVQALQQHAYLRNAGGGETRARRTLYEIPFDAWDKDKNERLDQGEFQGRGEAFVWIDRNRDALLSREEVEIFLREVNNSEFVKKYDANGDGRVMRAEFPGTDEVFQRADRNGDGVVGNNDR
jgi:Ca2+-binding EF-hand superfamily protein